MELKLNIYEKRSIAKTYTADTYDLMFGTVEDFCDLVNLDELKKGYDAEIIKMAGKALTSGMETVKDLFKDIFDGITDEELKKTKIKEMIKVIVEVIKYSINEINKGIKEKN